MPERIKQNTILLHISMSNLRFREFYRRRLPHIQIAGSTYFVTFRLKNSLPKDALERLAEETERIKELPKDETEIEYRRWFGKFDDYLDQVICGEPFLKNGQVADLISESVHYRDGKVYDLLAFCIMPNHVHLVFMPLEKVKGVFHSLAEILHSLKRHTARHSNLILGRSGTFWQDESYDHIVRNEKELERIIKYVLNNPVKAGLVETLSSGGPYTIFAPTDEAFEQLFTDLGVSGIQEIDTETLVAVLQYHVVEGNVLSTDLSEGNVATLNGDITFSLSGSVTINGSSQVVQTDIQGTNGVIHVIDAVLLPPSMTAASEEEMMDDAMMEDTPDIVDIAVSDGRFTTLVTALQQANLVDTLKGDGPFTVFAPTDDAFAALPDGTLDSLLADIPALTDVLLYHVVAGKVMAADVVNLNSADTVLGKPVNISVEGNTVKVNDAQVIITDIEGSNGVIHVIDAVLIPPADAPAALPVSGGEIPTDTVNMMALLVLGLILVTLGFGLRYAFARHK